MSVSLHCDDAKLAADAARQFRARGLPVRRAGSRILAVLPDYLDPWLSDLPPTAVIALVSPYGDPHWLGPILSPPATACYRCFARALVDNNYLPRSTAVNRTR